MRMIYKGKLLVLSALARELTRNGHKIHVSHLSRILRGERPPTKDFLKALGTVLGYTPKEAGQFLNEVQAALHEVDKLPHLIPERH